MVVALGLVAVKAVRRPAVKVARRPRAVVVAAQRQVLPAVVEVQRQVVEPQLLVVGLPQLPVRPRPRWWP